MNQTAAPPIDLDKTIIKAPDKRLRRRSVEVDPKTSAEVARMMLDMLSRHRGPRAIAGLSSVQVELPGRVIYWLENGVWRYAINPVVVERSEHMEVAYEGCFSLPEVWHPVRRPTRIELQHDYGVEPLSGNAARYALHELDHLDGILITDYSTRGW